MNTLSSIEEWQFGKLFTNTNDNYQSLNMVIEYRYIIYDTGSVIRTYSYNPYIVYTPGLI